MLNEVWKIEILKRFFKKNFGKVDNWIFLGQI